MKIHFSVKGIDLTRDLEKYTNHKLTRITRRIPRKLRTAAGYDIAFACVTRRGEKLNTCTIKLTVDDVELKASETTQHMYAALDIATVQIEQQLKDRVRRQFGGILRRHFRAG
jgi:ribosomal subunit interface protein